jgi:putative transposase
LFVVLLMMLHPTQELEPPANPARFIETFFKSLKAELIWRQSWPTRRQAEAAIFQYINGFYNTRRRHSYLGGISPLAFEAKAA